MTPLRSRYAQVNVWVPPEDPFIEDGPVIHVKESVQVKLECVARGGKPPAKVSFYRFIIIIIISIYCKNFFFG